MIQIFLNNLPAIPKGTNIKLTVENPYFTKSASYTYDVEFDLSIAENRKVFGNMNRMDCEKSKLILDAVLMVDNFTLLTGTATVVSVSEESVKVQLLGEAASYNYGNKMEETYIDELDLGDWYWTTFPDGSYMPTRPGLGVSGPLTWAHLPEDYEFKGNSHAVFIRLQATDSGYNPDEMMERLFDGSLPWVAFPVINTDADIMMNNYCYQRRSTLDNPNSNVYTLRLRANHGRPEWQENPREDDPQPYCGAVQPYVWLMAEKIAKATGFTLERSDNALYTDSFLKKIFIANANNYIECNKCLAHWTVNEWWTQLEQTFGLVMSVDYTTGTMKLRLRSDYYGSSVTRISVPEVVDEYTAEVDDETQADISVSNVGFVDYDNGPEDILSDFIRDNCKTDSSHATFNDLHSWAKNQGAVEIAKLKDTIFECEDNRRYIYMDGTGLIEVDMLRPRITDSRKKDLDVELKFVPARTVRGVCEIYQSGYIEAVGTFPVQVIQVNDRGDMDWYKKVATDSIDIGSLITDEDAEETSSEAESDHPDTIAIAMADFTMDTLNVAVTTRPGFTIERTQFDFPRARVRARLEGPLDGSADWVDGPWSLALTHVPWEVNLAAKQLGSSITVNTRIRYCIRFVSEQIPDVSAIFLIRNRKFVCEKIEANIDADGLDRLLTGYFYEFS